MYKQVIRPALFLFKPETVHNLVMVLLNLMVKLPGLTRIVHAITAVRHRDLEREIMGLKFSNPVGLAAGFDKDATSLKALGAMGFGFIEVGTVTPRPQPGNPKPRLFRLSKDRALINRMGFNNQGVDAVCRNLADRPPGLLIGGNIGKNKSTPNGEAIQDYAFCFERLFDYVDYFVVNVSSPNTPGLRHLQEKAPLEALLGHLKQLNGAKQGSKPILLKIAPDLSDGQLDDIMDIVVSSQIDGIVATNTTVERDGLDTPAEIVDRMGAGGLSGHPLKARSTNVIRYLRKTAPAGLVIIGVGGIETADDAWEKLRAGADLVQLYTGFIYEGPSVVRSINRGLLRNGAPA